jgi:hypothetical protein
MSCSYGSDVWFWNQRTKYFLQTKKEDNSTISSWDSVATSPPDSFVKGYDFGKQGHNMDAPQQAGDDFVFTIRNKDTPGEVLEIRFNPGKKDDTVLKAKGDVSPVARTLHPTGNGHASIGTLVEGVLKQTKWPPPNKDLAPLPPDNNKALCIMMEKNGDNYQWIFYDTPRSESAGCNTNKNVVFIGPTFTGVNIDDPPNPSGEYDMNSWGRPCKYRGGGADPGELICDNNHISCQKHTPSAITIDFPGGKKQHEGAFCEFFLESSNSIPISTQAAPSSTPTSAPTSGKSMALSIVLEEYIHDLPPTTMEWIFFSGEYGKDPTCDHNDAKRMKITEGPVNFDGNANLGLIDRPPLPGGTFKFNTNGQDCEYRNDGSNAGALICGNDPQYSCQENDERNAGEKATKKCMGDGGFEQVLHHSVINCKWWDVAN